MHNQPQPIVIAPLHHDARRLPYIGIRRNGTETIAFSDGMRFTTYRDGRDFYVMRDAGRCTLTGERGATYFGGGYRSFREARADIFAQALLETE